MKGIVYNLLEEVVTGEYGAETWDDLLDAAELDGAYTSLGSYPDQQLQLLVDHAAAMLNESPAGVLRWFGRRAILLLAQRYPQFFDRHVTTRTFVLTLNDIIHPEVRKIYPGADAPEFRFETSAPNLLIMEYYSARRMCGFARGMIEGAAMHFGEAAEIHETQCMLDGAACCSLQISFARQTQAA